MLNAPPENGDLTTTGEAMAPLAISMDRELPARWRRGSAERNAAACMLKRMRAGLDRRTRKVRRTRAAIRVGVYENDLKLHIAMDRLLADFMA